jgi:hypothetical protein
MFVDLAIDEARQRGFHQLALTVVNRNSAQLYRSLGIITVMHCCLLIISKSLSYVLCS